VYSRYRHADITDGHMIRQAHGQITTKTCNTFSTSTNKSPSSSSCVDRRYLLHYLPSVKKSELKNFRPVSNLSFLSKLLERVVQCRLQAFLDSNASALGTALFSTPNRKMLATALFVDDDDETWEKSRYWKLLVLFTPVENSRIIWHNKQVLAFTSVSPTMADGCN